MPEAPAPPPADPRGAWGVESCRAPGAEHEFRTITAEDWKRSIASARAQGNAALQQIRTAVAARLPKSR